MSPRPSITENGTRCGRHQEDITILILITLSCKMTSMKQPSGVPMLNRVSVILVTSNILAGIMITGKKSPATAVNILLAAAIANSINTEILRPLTYIRNGNDRFPNSRRFKIACGSGSLPSYQRLSTFLVFKLLVSCCHGIAEVVANAIPSSVGHRWLQDRQRPASYG